MKLVQAGESVFVGTGSRPLAEAGTRTIVMLHGAGMDHTVWVMPARHFARKGFRVIAPDFPGHGRSSGSPLTAVDAMADWLAQLLTGLKVTSAVVMGHSMGSLVACAFAARHAALCERLVLLGTAAPMPVTQRLLDAARDNDHAAIEMANSWSHSRGRLGGSENPGMWMMMGGARLIERSAPGVFYADLQACNDYDAGTLEKITVPATVIAGTADQMTSAAQGSRVSAVLSQRADCRLVQLPGSGHSMLSEYPNEVLDALIAALAD